MNRAAGARDNACDVILDTHTPGERDHGYHTPQKKQIVDNPAGRNYQLSMNAVQVEKPQINYVVTVKDMQNQRTAGHLFTDLFRPPTAA